MRFDEGIIKPENMFVTKGLIIFPQQKGKALNFIPLLIHMTRNHKH